MRPMSIEPINKSFYKYQQMLSHMAALGVVNEKRASFTRFFKTPKEQQAFQAMFIGSMMASVAAEGVRAALGRPSSAEALGFGGVSRDYGRLYPDAATVVGLCLFAGQATAAATLLHKTSWGATASGRELLAALCGKQSIIPAALVIVLLQIKPCRVHLLELYRIATFQIRAEPKWPGDPRSLLQRLRTVDLT